MSSAKHVMRIWCERLDSYFFSGSTGSDAPGITVTGITSPERTVTGIFEDSGSLATESSPGRFNIRLDSESTRLMLRSACSFTVLVSSRLGHDPHRHWEFGKFLMRSARQARCQGTVLLIADGSAVEPWARRAAQLTKANLLRVGFGNSAHQVGPNVWVRIPDGKKITCDEAIIAMANRIDALHVRRGGRIEACLKRRIDSNSHGSLFRCNVRVAVTPTPNSAASYLVKAGAIGWPLPELQDGGDSVAGVRQPCDPHRHETVGKRVFVTSQHLGLCTTRDWLHENESGQWLVHCTRASKGPWPGETVTAYRDAILTGDRRVASRTPLDSLCRIIQSGEILASALVSCRRYPVVCLSAVPLLQLLRQRCFRPHVQRWDYEPYGVAVRRRAIHQFGGRPVIYGEPVEAKKLPACERFRYQAEGKTHDWRKEKEWRLACSLSLKSLNPCDVRIFALDSALARSRLLNLPWKVTILQHVSKRTLKKIGNDALSEIWKAV